MLADGCQLTMAIPFLMPKLGLTMEAGTITEWLVDDGATVEAGDAVLVIATDKVETEVETPDSGVLSHSGSVGETFDCGTQIGWVMQPGEQPPAPTSAASASAEQSDTSVQKLVAAPGVTIAPRAEGERQFVSPNARRVGQTLGIDVSVVPGSGPAGRVVSEDVEAFAATQASMPPIGYARPSTVAVSPAGAMLARELGVSIDDVQRTSPDPRVTRRDVLTHVRDRYLSATASPTMSASQNVGGVPPSTDVAERIPMAGMRGTIAERMHDSMLSMAQLTLHMDANMTAVVSHREALRSTGVESLPSYTDYVISAVGKALTKHPRVNSQIIGDELQLLAGIHVGMAVALDDGLIVPVVHDADALTLSETSVRTTDIAARARNGKLGLADLEGGTISVSTLGAFGVDGFTPVINPPNTAIVGVGRIRKEVSWIDGQAAPVKSMTLSLTWDHRAFDGAPAAEFCAEIRNVLETWE